MTSPHVLVVGAGGALGRPVVRALRERGVAVRALCRQPQRMAALAASGVEVVTGDLIDRASLERACVGVDRVLACAHSLLGRGRWRSEAVDDAGHRALFEAAKAAGVRRIVYTSACGAAPDHPVDFFRTKHRVEQALAALGIEHAVLRPTAFMEWHAHEFNGKALLESGKARLIGPGTKRRNFVAASDVAGFAVRALLDEPLPFRTLEIGGTECFSNVEVAALYARLAGVPERRSHLPAALAGVLGSLMRPLHPGLARVMHLMSLPDDAFDEAWAGGAALEQAHGVTMTRLEDFVRERIAEHRGAQAAH